MDADLTLVYNLFGHGVDLNIFGIFPGRVSRSMLFSLRISLRTFRCWTCWTRFGTGWRNEKRFPGPMSAWRKNVICWTKLGIIFRTSLDRSINNVVQRERTMSLRRPCRMFLIVHILWWKRFLRSHWIIAYPIILMSRCELFSKFIVESHVQMCLDKSFIFLFRWLHRIHSLSQICLALNRNDRW